jgi:hypothetical protein
LQGGIVPEELVKGPFSELPCCPELKQHFGCDRLDFRYVLPFRPRLKAKASAVVDVVLHFHWERCAAGLVLGCPVYTITLLPGEEVRLFSSDRHSRWSYDKDTNLSYRHETTSEESYYTFAMAKAMSDLTVSESGTSSSSSSESWAEGGGGASFSFLGIINIGGGGGGGSYDASSARSFSHQLSRHAASSSSHIAAGVRAASPTAIGEVATRTHAEGESEGHYESSSRLFRNLNKCHAVTYLFYRINKLQVVRFKLVAIESVVRDPAAPTGVVQRPEINLHGGLYVRPGVVAATNPSRLELEKNARASAGAYNDLLVSSVRTLSANVAVKPAEVLEPLVLDQRKAALQAVHQDLLNAEMIDREGKPTEKLVAELSWEREEVLPTPGILVRGCLDNCDTCEPSLQKEIELNLEHKRLENEMLKRQVELLDQAQEYRCCPSGSEEAADAATEEE